MAPATLAKEIEQLDSAQQNAVVLFIRFLASQPKSGTWSVFANDGFGGQPPTKQPERREKPNIRDFIGYGRKFHPEYRSTEDVMRELREGEE